MYVLFILQCTGRICQPVQSGPHTKLYRSTLHCQRWGHLIAMSSPFFKEVKRKRPAALVTKFLRDLESGVFQTPKSFDVLSNFRTEELKLNKAGQSLRVAYHESPLILAFCRKYPQVCNVQLCSMSMIDPAWGSSCSVCHI